MGRDLSFTGVKQDQIAELWPHIEALVSKGCGKFRDYTPDEVFERLHSGSQLWVAGSAQAVTAICITRLHHDGDCDVELCAGDRVDQIIEFLPIIEAWAKESGALRVRIEGRPGWMKKLQNYRLKKVVMEKML